MLSTKNVVGDRFITLSLEMFSLYKDIIATRVSEDLLVMLTLMLEMLVFSTNSTVGHLFISLVLELPMLSTKNVVGDRFITLLLEMFSLYKDSMATHVMEDLLVMLTLIVVSACVMEDILMVVRLILNLFLELVIYW